MKSYDALVCETKELKCFIWQSDRDRWAEEMTRQGYLVLRGVSYR